MIDLFCFRNNAGVMFCPFQLSEDGIEMQFATNHLGNNKFDQSYDLSVYISYGLLSLCVTFLRSFPADKSPS